MTIPPLSSSEDESARSLPGYDGERAASVGSEPSAAVQVLIEPDDLTSLIRDAYLAGCRDVQENYRPLREGEDPEFGEASYDYVASLDFTETTKPLRPAPSDPSTAWRGIASAPRDGTKLLVTYAPATGKAPIKIAWCFAENRDPKWRIGLNKRLRFSPTHWMPLPGAPS